MTTATVTPSKSGKPAKFRRDHKINWWLTAAVAVLSLTILIPLYFTIVTALKTPAEAGTFALPTSWQWHNFADASAKVNYPKAALNSAIITVAAVVLTLLTNTFVAYAVARNMDKRFFRFLYYFFIAAMFVPFPVVMLPIAKQMGSLHLDNQVGLIILYTVLGLGTNLFIATGFIRSIPVSLEEAARIDGASTWRIFWTIIFPLMSPINATIAILTALWAWNDFLLPLIILTDQSNQTIPLAQYVFSSQFATNYPMAFSSYLMAMAPILIVYIFAQKWGRRWPGGSSPISPGFPAGSFCDIRAGLDRHWPSLLRFYSQIQCEGRQGFPGFRTGPLVAPGSPQPNSVPSICPISRGGVGTMVLNPMDSATSDPSKPKTETSSGIRTPIACNSCTTRNA